MSIRDSAILCRISPSTLENWLSKGRYQIKELEAGTEKTIEFGHGTTLHMELVRRLEETQVRLKEELYGVALKQAFNREDGQMALNLLARKWPSEFGKKDTARNTMVLVNLTQSRMINARGGFDESEFDAYIHRIEQRDLGKGLLESSPPGSNFEGTEDPSTECSGGE
jgi:hypothetical protein